MPVKIRLSRIGKKGVPFYRIVAVNSRKKRDGAFLDDLGTYDGLRGELVTFHKDRFDDWRSKGAVVTNAAEKLFKMYNKQKRVKKLSD